MRSCRACPSSGQPCASSFSALGAPDRRRPRAKSRRRPPGGVADHVLVELTGSRPSASARRPVLTARRAREHRPVALRDPRAHAPGRARSKTAGSTSIPACPSYGRRRHLQHARQRQFDRGASTITQRRAQLFLPKMPRHDAAGSAREVAPPQAAHLGRSSSRRASKDAILEIPERHDARPARVVRGGRRAGATLFFGKTSATSHRRSRDDYRRVRSPSALSPFNNPARCKERHTVLQSMNRRRLPHETPPIARSRAAGRRPARARSEAP